MITITERSSEAVESSLGILLHAPRDKPTLVGAMASEILRAMIFGTALAQKNASGARTIHTTRLMASARRAIDLVWPGSSGDSVGSVDVCGAMLDSLALLGDVANTGQGQRLATPLRIVVPHEGPSCLVVGSAPVPVVRKMIGNEPRCAGPTRFLGQRVLDKSGNRDIAQSVDAWLGHVAPLEPWTAQILAVHKARMDLMQDTSADQLEIYAPDLLQKERRPGRWIAAGDVHRPIEGIRLCQPQMRYARSYDTPHYLVEFDFKNGTLVQRRSVQIRRDLTLRLRFGLDVVLGTPRDFSIADDGETFRIDRPLQLPEPEQRIYALGWNDRRAGIADRLVFHKDAMPILRHALNRLSITPSITPRSRS